MRDLTSEEIEEAIFHRKDGETAKAFLYGLIAEDGQERVYQLVDSAAYLNHWRHGTIMTVKQLVNRMYTHAVI